MSRESRPLTAILRDEADHLIESSDLAGLAPFESRREGARELVEPGGAVGSPLDGEAQGRARYLDLDESVACEPVDRSHHARTRHAGGVCGSIDVDAKPRPPARRRLEERFDDRARLAIAPRKNLSSLHLRAEPVHGAERRPSGDPSLELEIGEKRSNDERPNVVAGRELVDPDVDLGVLWLEDLSDQRAHGSAGR